MKEIAEGNKLIAEFMGFKTYPKNHYHCYPDIPKITSLVPPQHMRFHESWDWIIPVVERISVINTDMHKNYELYADRIMVLDSLVEVNINFVWESVVEFIKTFNNQNKES